MNKKYLSLLIALFVSSCEVIVDVDVPLENPKITLNSIFVQDSTWKVQLMLNRHILDEGDFKVVDDAQVIIFEEGFAIDTLSSQNNGVYRGVAHAVPGRTYEVEALSPSYGSVYSRCYMPLPVPIDNVQVNLSQGPTADRREIDITFEMTDRPGETNYYQLVVFSERKYQDQLTGEERISTFTVPLEGKDLIMSNAVGRPNEGLFFKDEMFAGKPVSLKFGSPYFFHENDTLELTFYLRTLSKDYYQYHVTSQIQERTSNDPFAEPVSVYNNIEQGFGIFGGASQSVFFYEE